MRWIIFGLLFSLISTWYFGWNIFGAETHAEISCDIISSFIVLVGISKELIKNTIKKHEKIHHNK